MNIIQKLAKLPGIKFEAGRFLKKDILNSDYILPKIN